MTLFTVFSNQTSNDQNFKKISDRSLELSGLSSIALPKTFVSESYDDALEKFHQSIHEFILESDKKIRND